MWTHAIYGCEKCIWACRTKQLCLKAISFPTELPVAYLEHSLIHKNTVLFLFLGRGSVAVQKLRLPKVEIDGGTYHD